MSESTQPQKDAPTKFIVNNERAQVFFVHGQVDPNDPQGRTYKEVNAEKQHAIRVGALVEITCDDKDDEMNGCRLRVTYHGRDCDMTPLYWLGMGGKDVSGGWPESALKVIRP